MSSPVGGAEAEAARPLLHAHAAVRSALVEAVADLVEVRVARLGERLGKRHRAVDERIPVPEALPVEAVVGDGVHWSESYAEKTCSCIPASAVTGFQVEPGG